jgi:hypothetical protein
VIVVMAVTIAIVALGLNIYALWASYRLEPRIRELERHYGIRP